MQMYKGSPCFFVVKREKTTNIKKNIFLFNNILKNISYYAIVDLMSDKALKGFHIL